MSTNISAFPAGSLPARLLAALPGARIIRQRIVHGKAIFRRGDPVAAIHLLESGRIRLARTLEDGTSATLHVAESGESFAEASLSAEVYHCDAIAEMDSVVVSLPKADLLTALAADPVQSLALAVALATQVRDLRSRLELRNIRSAPARLMAWLCLQADGNPPVAVLHRSWTLTADELGLTREAVYRGLALLERQNRIRRQHNTVRLLHPPPEML